MLKYWDVNDQNVACTDNVTIRINCGHKMVTKTRGRLNRYQIISGLFAHELGHVLYTDFLEKQTFDIDGIRSGNSESDDALDPDYAQRYLYP